MGPRQRELIEKEVESMRVAGAMKPSRSEWASVVVLTPKTDRTLRFFVNYRLLMKILHRTCTSYHT